MDHEHNPYTDPVEGATTGEPGAAGPAPRQRHRVSRLSVGAALVAFFAMAGAGVAFAVSPSSTKAPSKSPSKVASTQSTSGSTGSAVTTPHMKGPLGPLGGPRGARFGIGGDVLHGQFTVSTPGGDREVLVQTGHVTAVSSTSITVSSTDKYTHTYTVQSSTIVDSQSGGISTVAVNDQVRLQAVAQGGGDVATNIVDVTKIGSSRKGFGFGGPKPSPAAAVAPGAASAF